MSLREVRAITRRGSDEFVLNRIYGSVISPYFTIACLRLGLSPDQVTVLGGACGLVAISLLFAPIGWWSVVGVAFAQVGYILDFSDGQVARMSGRSSIAGSYLDWLTHLYVPVGAAFAIASSLAWETAWFGWLVLGTAAALELAIFPFSAKEHVLVAFQRRFPEVSAWAPFHAALADDARPDDVDSAPDEPARPLKTGLISGRTHAPTLRSIVGELLIYPGALHLVTAAVIIDFVVGDHLPFPARGVPMGAWALLLAVHSASAIRRNHRLIARVEARSSRRSTE